MRYYALVFLVVGVIACAMNLTGVSAVAVQISWVLFLIGIVRARSMWLRDAPVGLRDLWMLECPTVFRREGLTSM